MRIAFGCDHRGFPYKAGLIQALTDDGHCVQNNEVMRRALGAPAVDTEGGYAEFVCVPANMGIKVPDGVDWHQHVPRPHHRRPPP